MERCYVCATSLAADVPRCPQCGTERELLQALARKAAEQRFLFGSETGPETDQAPPPPEPVKAAPPRISKKRPRPKPKEREASHLPDRTDLIRNRDVVVDRAPEPEPQAIYRRGLAHLIDVVLCLFLNFWILKLILMITNRGFSQLLTYSLIPLLFVMLGFTALYFWLFKELFQKSLGGLLVHHFTKKS